MNINKFSLRTRIFIAMIFIVVIASVLIAAVTIYQYNEQSEEYHNNRLERKEEAIKSAISYELNRDTIKEFETTARHHENIIVPVFFCYNVFGGFVFNIH